MFNNDVRFLTRTSEDFLVINIYIALLKEFICNLFYDAAGLWSLGICVQNWWQIFLVGDIYSTRSNQKALSLFESFPFDYNILGNLLCVLEIWYAWNASNLQYSVHSLNLKSMIALTLSQLSFIVYLNPCSCVRFI